MTAHGDMNRSATLPSMPAGRSPLLAAIALLSLWVSPLALGQESAPASPLQAPAGGPEFVPAAQIPARASSARLTLDAIRTRLPTATAATGEQLSAMGNAIDRLSAQADFGRLDRIPEFRIAELQRQVEFYRRELAKRAQ